MQYREFGSTGLKLSALGFGAMRLPILDGDVSRIDEDKAIEMIRYAVDHGINYFDTAWPYRGGESEAFLARALSGGYREKVSVGTKLPSWEIKERSRMDEYLEKQLRRLKIDRIDLYLLHALNSRYLKTMKELDYASLEQVKQNIRTASKTFPGSLSSSELNLIERVTEAYRKRIAVDCTNCRYCMPCPSGVNIPELFWAYNHASLFDDEEKLRYWVNEFLTASARPSACVACGACEEHCPQNLPIIETLKKIGTGYEKV